jgi:hypothetical protein
VRICNNRLSFRITEESKGNSSIFITNTNYDITEQFAIKIYSNPTAKVLNVVGLENEVAFVIHDLTGREVMKGKTEKEINVSGLTVGHYILTLKDLEFSQP